MLPATVSRQRAHDPHGFCGMPWAQCCSRVLTITTGGCHSQKPVSWWLSMGQRKGGGGGEENNTEDIKKVLNKVQNHPEVTCSI